MKCQRAPTLYSSWTSINSLSLCASVQTRLQLAGRWHRLVRRMEWTWLTKWRIYFWHCSRPTKSTCASWRSKSLTATRCRRKRGRDGWRFQRGNTSDKRFLSMQPQAPHLWTCLSKQRTRRAHLCSPWTYVKPGIKFNLSNVGQCPSVKTNADSLGARSPIKQMQIPDLQTVSLRPRCWIVAGSILRTHRELEQD